MNTCRTCGEPKELHEKIEIPSFMPMVKPIMERVCPVEEHRARRHRTAHDDPDAEPHERHGELVPYFRVDRKEMVKRKFADEELRKEELEDRREEAMERPKLDGVHIFALSGEARLNRAVLSSQRRDRNKTRAQCRTRRRRRKAHGRK